REVRGLEHDLAYRGIASGDLDVTDVYTTDPEIEAQHLALLEDDLGFFPRYDAVLVYRQDLQARAPAVVPALRRLEAASSAARRPRLGQLVLAAVGVVPTIPSLALLVFMIPLLGIGTVPACVALFLYSLLPIVRNTVAGLADIPPSLRESAEALGLSPGAIL